MTKTSARTLALGWSEVLLYGGLFLLLYLGLPYAQPLVDAASVPFPQLGEGSARLVLLLPILVACVLLWTLGESFLLLSKVERRLACLLLGTWALAFPGLSLTAALVLDLYLLLRYLSFDAYQDPQRTQNTFYSGCLLGGLTLLRLDYASLLLVLLASFYTLRSFSLRGLLAMLFGYLLTPWLVGALLLVLSPEALTAWLGYLERQVQSFVPIGMVQLLPSQIPYLGLLGLLLLLAWGGYRGRYYRESVRHRDMVLSLQHDGWIFILLSLVFPRSLPVLLPMALVSLAMTLARGMGSCSRRTAHILRVLILLSLLVVMLLQRLGWERITSLLSL